MAGIPNQVEAKPTIIVQTIDFVELVGRFCAKLDFICSLLRLFLLLLNHEIHDANGLARCFGPVNLGRLCRFG